MRNDVDDTRQHNENTTHWIAKRKTKKKKSSRKEEEKCCWIIMYKKVGCGCKIFKYKCKASQCNIYTRRIA